MTVTMQTNETWTLWSLVLLILILTVDSGVHAENSYDGYFKGCISHWKTQVKDRDCSV